ncbi:MAG TPA: DNA polymerase IV [Acidobacteriota bacterium]|nr:DNA polymerase IV [Acidobacteriota bacterium]
MARTLFHVDMDAFYASVEQRRQPEYKGRPVIVGSDPKKGQGRGVVAACSYEAREFGIHSAMPISQAWRACPDGVYLRPDFKTYRQVSRRIREVFRRFTPLVEPISIDEAFLDVSAEVDEPRQALELGSRLKREIYQAEWLTASVGIGPCKLVAKIASDFRKPNGLHMVTPDQVQDFLDPLPTKRIWGVGPKTAKRLQKMGVETILQLRTLEKERLIEMLGKFGGQLYKLARGQDARPVVTQHETKSVSQETTFSEDVTDSAVLEETLGKLARQVSERVQKAGLEGKTITLKLRYEDFTTITRQVSSRFPTTEADIIISTAVDLLRRYLEEGRAVRLIGVGLSNFETEDPDRPRQLRLF